MSGCHCWYPSQESFHQLRKEPFFMKHGEAAVSGQLELCPAQCMQVKHVLHSCEFSNIPDLLWMASKTSTASLFKKFVGRPLQGWVGRQLLEEANSFTPLKPILSLRLPGISGFKCWIGLCFLWADLELLLLLGSWATLPLCLPGSWGLAGWAREGRKKRQVLAPATCVRLSQLKSPLSVFSLLLFSLSFLLYLVGQDRANATRQAEQHRASWGQ